MKTDTIDMGETFYGVKKEENWNIMCILIFNFYDKHWLDGEWGGGGFDA
jgi:hypothetical protein